jgi:predicted small integral membrane protein
MGKSRSIRASKIVLISGIGCMALAAAFNNVIDYQSNFLFVQHVMTMDTVYPTNVLKYRAIDEPLAHSAVYTIIIILEFATAALTLFGAVQMLRHINSDTDTFNSHKMAAVLGLSCGFVLWFFGFIVIGGEWFCMWQSPHWNGQEAAFRYVACIVLVLIYTAQSDKIPERSLSKKQA